MGKNKKAAYSKREEEKANRIVKVREMVLKRVYSNNKF